MNILNKFRIFFSQSVSPLIHRFLATLHLTSFPPAVITLIIFSFLIGPILFITTAVSGVRAFSPAATIPSDAAQVPARTSVDPSRPDLEDAESPRPVQEGLATPTFTSSPTVTFTATETYTPTITSTPTVTFTHTVTFTPTITLPAADGSSCVSPEAERVKARVVRITDGDTIVVLIDGVEYKLRYIGIDAPESSAAGGSRSTSYNRQLVEGKTVTLVMDHSETDRYDRLLRYVFVGNTFVNYEMIRAGYATSGSWPPDTACDQVFAQAEQSARQNKRGLWQPTVTPLPYIPPPATAAPTSGGIGIIGGGSNCDPAYPDVCIAPPPPDLDCKQIPYRRFRVLPPDPHNFDGDGDGIGCES